MKELLERWSRLEPDRCRWGDDSYREWYSALYDGDDEEAWFDGKPNLPYLQAAVQEAITARGWAWEVGYYTGRDPFYVGFVDASPQAHALEDYKHHDSYGDNPALSLLAAYLQALEGL
jgi:hypothetical protein